MRVMFVDDDQNVLDAIRRTLHGVRDTWAMEFVSSGPEALAALARAPADVVVADMRMHGMDGPTLLAEVKRLYPEAVRFILSGHAEPNTIMGAAGIAHQYLAKPCNSAVLKAAIARTQTLRTLLHDERMARWVGTVDTLPSLPRAYQEIVACLQQPDASLADVGRIVCRDVAMTAMILKLVNSAFFGAPQSIRTVDRAVSFLGLDTIASLVLAHGVFADAGIDATPELDLGRLWHHSVQAATAARVVARLEVWDTARVEEAFLAAFLHDIGRVVLARRPRRVASRNHPTQPDRLGCAFDADHAEAGAYLLGIWGFSDTIVEAVAFHHIPSQATDSGFGLAALVHVADVMAHQCESGGSTPDAPALDPLLGESAYVTARWGEWQAAWSRELAEPAKESA
jgi:HD-like signal output (HDOD) protein/ActR/RegA family two-component response regulator